MIRNDAIAVYMSGPACAVAFVARWCLPGDPPGIDFPPPVLTPEEEAEALAEAEYADDMGLEPEEDTYILLSARTEDDALAEAEEIWRTQTWRSLKWLRISEPHNEATGFCVWRADWMSAGVFQDGAYLVGDESGCADGLSSKAM